MSDNIIEKYPKGERYKMCKDQPAQIDCGVTRCVYNRIGGNCDNISPAISLNETGRFVCWSQKDIN